MNRILVIDDQAPVRRLMATILTRAGYQVAEADCAERVFELLEDPELGLVVSDIVMPGLSGFELLDEVRVRRPSLPVLFVTGSGTEDNLSEALARGAAGLITKPFTHSEFRDRVTAVLARALRGEEEVRERVIAPVLTRALASAVTARDLTTGGHTERLVALAVRLGRELALSSHDLEGLRLGATLHDIGKIGIPDAVLLKPGPLEPEERALMQSHTLIGERLLEAVPELAAARPIVRWHHERWNGEGYPDGLVGAATPLLARIVAVADGIEAMSARRPYRDPLPLEDVWAELEAGRGTQWDPRIVDVALDLIRCGQIQFGADGAKVLLDAAA